MHEGITTLEFASMSDQPTLCASCWSARLISCSWRGSPAMNLGKSQVSLKRAVAKSIRFVNTVRHFRPLVLEQGDAVAILKNG